MPGKIAIKQAIDAIIDARLGAINGVELVEVEASGDPSKFPSLNRTASKLAADNFNEVGVTWYKYYFSIEGYVEGAGGQVTSELRDELYVALIKALPPDPEIFGSGLVEEFEEQETRFAVATLASRRNLAFITDFVATFPADPGSPTTVI